MPASSLHDEYTLLATNAQFTARVRMAYTHLARDVLTEDQTTPGNPLRASFARSVLNPGDLATPALAALIATDPAISTAAAAGLRADDPDSAQAAVTDTQILTAVQAAWNIAAGVTPAETSPA
ncbi:hypothetical protein U9R90_26645 [Streptomyces sp. E11-3]|uniref:hypothetical protein n=1 Tax=Streptomyces sp. E11-3 TaxID=3110112 RepID=UPI00398025D9